MKKDDHFPLKNKEAKDSIAFGNPVFLWTICGVLVDKKVNMQYYTVYQISVSGRT